MASGPGLQMGAPLLTKAIFCSLARKRQLQHFMASKTPVAFGISALLLHLLGEPGSFRHSVDTLEKLWKATTFSEQAEELIVEGYCSTDRPQTLKLFLARTIRYPISIAF